MSMAGYTKLFNSILASTIWREDDKTRIIWITLLAMANKEGIAEGSIPGLADLARVSIQDCEAALEKLKAPDKYSRTQEHDGRRIADCDGGWKLLNHGKYRAKMSADERRDYNRVKQQEHRQKVSTSVNDSQTKSALSAHTEAKADSESETKEETPPIVVASLPKEMDFWNMNCGTLPKAQSTNTKRNAALRARRADPFWVENYPKAVFEVMKSEFCNGKNDRGWKADFDFMIQPDTVTKVMEGKYQNRNGYQKERPAGGNY